MHASAQRMEHAVRSGLLITTEAFRMGLFVATAACRGGLLIVTAACRTDILIVIHILSATRYIYLRACAPTAWCAPAPPGCRASGSYPGVNADLYLQTKYVILLQLHVVL